MEENPYQGWIEKTARYSGVLACGVRLPNQCFAIKTFDDSFSEARLKDLLEYLNELSLNLRNQQLTGSRLRWAFEHVELQSARRKDGTLAVLAMKRDPASGATSDQLLNEFLAAV